MTGKPLKDKQMQFARELASTDNVSESGRRVGWSERHSFRMAGNVRIKAEVRRLREQAADKAEVDVERVVAEFARLAFSDLRDVIRIEGGRVVATDTADLTPDQAAALQEIAQTKDGLRVKLASKQAALDSLARYLGMNKDALRVELGEHPEWPLMLAKLQAALARYPDAAAAVAEALEDE